MKWWEKSNEDAFRVYGDIFDNKLKAFLKLEDHFEINAIDICDLPDRILKRLDSEDKKIIISQLNPQRTGQLSADDIIFDEYRKNFQAIKTNIVYTIGCFLFFLDEIRLIDAQGQIKPLSLYAYYSSAIKSLGDCVGLMEELAILLIDSRRFSEYLRINKNRRRQFYSDLKKIHEESTEYPKEFRNYLTHRGYLRFHPEGTVPVYDKEDFGCMPEDVVIGLFRAKARPSEYLGNLFDEVAKGIDKASDYIMSKVLRIPNWRHEV